MSWLVRSTVAALFVVAAATLTAVSFSTSSADSVMPSELSTPMWSARRVPYIVTDPIEPPRLTAALMPSISGYGDACFTVADGDRYFAEYNADVPLTPASAQKLLTAAAALSVLGADHTFTTRVVADGDSAGGTVNKLWLVGSGDPDIATAPYAEPVSTRLESLADAVVAAGIRQVTGGIAGDDSRYQDAWYLMRLPSYHDKFEVGPVSALTVNDGIVLVRGHPVIVDDPAVYAASELTNLLRARGVRVDGAPTRETAPAGAANVAIAMSKPLHDIITAMLVTSDNLTAELLAREIGTVRSGQGTTAAGTAAILAELRHLGAPLDGVVMHDGSGLDRGNRLTCRALVDVLALASRPGFEVLSSALPAVSAFARAKGGYLDEVTGLAGFSDAPWPVRFSVLLNDNLSPKPRDDLARFIDALWTAPRPPAPDQLVPAPRQATRPRASA